MKKIQYIAPALRVVQIVKTPILQAGSTVSGSGFNSFGDAGDGDNDEDADARRGGFLWDEY